MSLAALKQRIADLVPPPPVSGEEAFPSGIDALDRLLPSGGLPRGRLSELLGPRGCGKTTIARRVVETARARGIWVAWIDATRTLAPRDWAHVGRDGMWVIRPPEPARAAWCADVLLRSGAFGLVVLDGAPPLSRAVAVRLTRLARDADCALLALGEESGASLLPGALRLSARRRRRRREERKGRVDGWPSKARASAAPSSPAPAMIAITIEKGGVRRTVEVGCAVRMARRLCTHSEVPDRRGVGARGAASAPATAGVGVADGAGADNDCGLRTEDDCGLRAADCGPEQRCGLRAADCGHAAPSAQHEPRTPPRKRRCAEPTLGRARASLPPTIGEGCGRRQRAVASR